MKPEYCCQPDLEACMFCNLVVAGMDCANNPIIETDIDELTAIKYQKVYDHPALATYERSEKAPFLDILDESGLLDELTIDQLAKIVILMKTAYHNGQRSMGEMESKPRVTWLEGVEYRSPVAE